MGELARPGEARRHQEPSRKCGGCVEKVARTYPGRSPWVSWDARPVSLMLFVGWEATARAVRSSFIVEKSAEAVVRAGLAVLLAGGSPVGPTPSGVRSQRRG